MPCHVRKVKAEHVIKEVGHVGAPENPELRAAATNIDHFEGMCGPGRWLLLQLLYCQLALDVLYCRPFVYF
jgi:hypothetical protein